MAGKNDNFDALMAMMALKHIMDDTKDIEIHPFTCEVTVTPTPFHRQYLLEIRHFSKILTVEWSGRRKPATSSKTLCLSRQ